MGRSHQGHIRYHSATRIEIRLTSIIEMMRYKDTQRSIVSLAGIGEDDDEPAVYVTLCILHTDRRPNQNFK